MHGLTVHGFTVEVSSYARTNEFVHATHLPLSFSGSLGVESSELGNLSSRRFLNREPANNYLPKGHFGKVHLSHSRHNPPWLSRARSRRVTVRPASRRGASRSKLVVLK